MGLYRLLQAGSGHREGISLSIHLPAAFLQTLFLLQICSKPFFRFLSTYLLPFLTVTLFPYFPMVCHISVLWGFF